MPFYFAWVGGTPIPPFTLHTLGDVWSGKRLITGSTWGGELVTNGDIFGTGVHDAFGPNVTNLRSDAGLRVGGSYQFIIAKTNAVQPNTSFIYEGNFGGRLNPPVVPAENTSITLRSIMGLNEVVLDDITGLRVGDEYGIESPNLPVGTTFIFEGDPVITVSQNATATGQNIEFTITFPFNQNIVSNLGDTTGLEVGQTYSAFGIGLGSGYLATFQSDGTLLLSKAATDTADQTFLTIHRNTIYPDGGPFDPLVHARKDEFLLSIELEHNEGHFPSLKIGMKNPRIGLLAPTRNVWCWLSWHRVVTDPVIPLFHGRLMALPADILNERVELSFVAEPGDYEQQRNFLTEGLKVLPNYDPVWFADGNGTPDTILEGYTQDWHTDRNTLEVSTSDILVGEDGTLVVQEGEHIRADMNLQIATTPTGAVYIEATAGWNQQATGIVDITRPLWDAFNGAGSGTYGFPNINSYSGDGLLADWPKPKTSIGGGWSVDVNSVAYDSPAFPPKYIAANFNSQMPYNPSTAPQQEGATGLALSVSQFENPWQYWQSVFRQTVLYAKFIVDYEASRAWQEKVTFFVQADLQPMATDGAVDTFSLTTNILDQPIDPGGGIPLFDPRTNTYFKTARGQQSFQWLLYYLIAKLAFKARAVSVTFTTRFDTVAVPGVSCRWSATVFDPRIPGGQATGKITSYKLLASASGGMRAVVTIGCTIGHGGVSASPVEGVGTYAAPGYMAPGYQAMTGATVGLPGGELTYQSFDDFSIVDDGVNFFNMTPDAVIKRLNVIAGAAEQLKAILTINSPQANPPPIAGAPPDFVTQPDPQADPAGALKNVYTRVQLEMVPVDGSGFETIYTVNVSNLQFPKTIDLEAPSL